MKKILIVNKVQFGYHTDIYKWCQYLRDRYNVTEISLFQGKACYTVDGIESISIKTFGPRVVRGLIFLLSVIIKIVAFNGIVIVCYFPYCEIIKKMLPWKRMILDIRTLEVNPDANLRKAGDDKIINACKCYDFVSIISDGLRQKIALPKQKSAVVPLGSDIVSTSEKDFSSIRLLYVGTLDYRDIDKTIKGLALFLKTAPKSLAVHYDIIGDGLHGELQQYKELVAKLGLNNHVALHGYIQHEKLKDFYDNCNVGVSFVPMTDYYEFQPVTKTFEYALSGLYTIGTATYSNKEVINENNGLLIEDTPESFANALTQIVSGINVPSSKLIKDSMKKYLWRNIVVDYFIPMIEKNEIL